MFLNRCKSSDSHPSEQAHHRDTAPPDTAHRAQTHARIDEIEKAYKKLPRDVSDAYRERAGIVRESAYTLGRGAPSPDTEAKLRCHAQEMESLVAESLVACRDPDSMFESNLRGAWRHAPRNAVDLQVAFVQLEGIWSRVPPEQRAWLDAGLAMKDGDPESLFKMRPVYEQLVDAYLQDCKRKGTTLVLLD